MGTLDTNIPIFLIWKNFIGIVALKSMKWKKVDTKTVYLSWNRPYSFPPKSSEWVMHSCRFQEIYEVKSIVVSDPLWGFLRQTYNFSIKTQISYRLSYPTWTLVWKSECVNSCFIVLIWYKSNVHMESLIISNYLFISTEMNESCTLSQSCDLSILVQVLHFQFYKNISRDKYDVIDW